MGKNNVDFKKVSLKKINLFNTKQFSQRIKQVSFYFGKKRSNVSADFFYHLKNSDVSLLFFFL